MRVIALLATYNEQRFIANCIEHLWWNGVETYLIDNDSTDRTLEIAERYRGRGLVGTERLPRDGYSRLRERCERKEILALELDADWFVHLDADEIRLPPSPWQTLREAFEEVERQGCNAVDFQEFVFVPTRESPDHDHAGYLETMRWYYPFLPRSPHRLNAWKRQPARVDLAWSAGHQVRFPGLTMYPRPFPMRHYMYLSVAHAIRKYVPLRVRSAGRQAGLAREACGASRRGHRAGERGRAARLRRRRRARRLAAARRARPVSGAASAPRGLTPGRGQTPGASSMSERAGAQADREGPPARRRELEVLAVVRVRQVLDREGQRQPIAAARQVRRPSRARCTVKPSSDSRSCAIAERRGEQRRRDPR